MWVTKEDKRSKYIICFMKQKNILWIVFRKLEALAVNNSGAGFVVFFLGDPHSLESGERGKDGATDPYGVFSLRGSNDLDFDGGRSKSSDFFLHTISNTRVHGGTTRKNSVGVQVLTDINVALHD